MKKTIALSLAFVFSGAAMASDLFKGDGTYFLVDENKASSLTRAEVIANTDSSNIANSLDASVAPTVRANPMLSRAEVIRKMEKFQYADFGDGTSMTPWMKQQSDDRNYAKEEASSPKTSTN